MNSKKKIVDNSCYNCNCSSNCSSNSNSNCSSKPDIDEYFGKKFWEMLNCDNCQEFDNYLSELKKITFEELEYVLDSDVDEYDTIIIKRLVKILKLYGDNQTIIKQLPLLRETDALLYIMRSPEFSDVYNFYFNEKLDMIINEEKSNDKSFYSIVCFNDDRKNVSIDVKSIHDNIEDAVNKIKTYVKDNYSSKENVDDLGLEIKEDFEYVYINNNVVTFRIMTKKKYSYYGDSITIVRVTK